MAKYQVGGQIVGGSSINTAVRTPVPQIVGNEGTVALARGVENFGRGAQDAAETWAHFRHGEDLKDDELGRIRGRASYAQQTQEAVSKLDPADPTYADQVARINEETMAGVLEGAGLKTQAARDQLERELTGESEFGAVAAYQTHRDARAAVAVSDHEQATNQLYAQILRDPGATDAYVSEFDQTHAALAAAMPPDKARELALKTLHDARAAQVVGFAQQGQFDAADALLAENAGSFSPGKAASLSDMIGQYRNQAHSQQMAAGAAALSDIMTPLYEDVPDPARLGQAEDGIEQLYADNRITPAQRVTAHRSIAALRNKGRAASDTTTGAWGRYLAEDAPGLNNQGEADAVWKDGVKRGIFSQDDLKDALAFHARAGYAPEPVRGLFNRVERSAEPAQVAMALDYMRKLREVNPGAAAQLDPGQTFRDAEAQFELDHDPTQPATAGYQVAAQKAINNRSLPPETRKARRDELAHPPSKSPLAGITGQSLLEDLDLTDLPGWFTGDAVDTTGGTTAAAKRMFDTAYETTGDVEVAKKMVGKQMQREYGHSGVGGRAHLTRFPPDQFIQSWAGEATVPVLDAYAQTALEAHGLALPKPANAVAANQPSMIYHETYLTERQIAAGQRPEYEIWVRDADGTVRPSGVKVPLPTPEDVANYPAMKAQRRKLLVDTRDSLELERTLASVGITRKGVAQELAQFSLKPQGLKAHPFHGWMKARREAATGQKLTPDAEAAALTARINQLNQQIDALGLPAPARKDPSYLGRP